MKNTRKRSGLPASVEQEIRAWEQAGNGSVSRDTEANAALATLFYKQCDIIAVLDLLSSYCGVRMDLPALRQRAKQFLKRTDRLARRLKQDAEEVRAVDQFLKLEIEFPSEMLELSQYLHGMYAEEVKSTVLSRGSGLQAELIDAVRLLKMTTGRPHYRELAEIARALDGTIRSEDDLRKAVSGFENSSSLFGSRSDRELQRIVQRGRAKFNKLTLATKS